MRSKSPTSSSERSRAMHRHAGDLATIGRKAAVVRLDSIHLTGFIGWLFWSVVHVYFLIGVRNRFVVAFSWFWSYLTYQRGARLITGDSSRALGCDLARQPDSPHVEKLQTAESVNTT